MAIATPPTALRLTKWSEPPSPLEPTLDWTPRARLLGILGGWTLFGIGVAYAVTMVAAFLSAGNLTDPIKDPHLAIMELLILVQAPLIIVMFAVIHAYAGRANRVLSLSALALVCLTAAITISVHFVLLTFGRQVSPAAIPGFTQLFSWHWPSVFYALDILAWDFCFGLSLLAAAPIFGGQRLGRSVRTGMLVAGTLCLVGLAGRWSATCSFETS
jgi:hypothetical protein